MATLLYQGHASFRLTTDKGTVVYIDPFANEGIDVPADVVLITHEHHDHNNVEMLTLAPDCDIARASDMLVGGLHLEKEIRDMRVEAVPACNANHPIEECVGYLIYVDGMTLYFAGDTSRTDFMADTLAEMDIDYAFLPCDGVYNMGREEAEACARIIRARHTVPIHTAPSASGDECAFDEVKAFAFEAEGKIVMHPGETLELV